MKASLQWMKEYVPVNLDRPAQELADTLTQAGIPVEEVQHLDNGIKKIYTGQIIAIEKHPDADKLQVCQVKCLEEGQEVVKQIVTAATNVAVGQVVPVAYHKSRLADGTEIKKGKLRGVASEGMFCSVAEFGLSKDLVLPEEATGIYIFPEGTPIGEDIKTVLGMDDVVYEFELTPNRSDCFSMVGLSREFAVLTREEAVMPTIEVTEEGESIEGRLHISIEDESLCSRFMGRLVENVVVGPSPLWMQNRLRAVGIRPINNVVDVTNYVMIELGQPMHAYDYDKLAGHSLVARKAKAGEVLVTLDESERVLEESMLVIGDEVKAVGVAGVMGGLHSEVTNATTTVALEAAVFNGASIRRTARAIGLRSEASGRFERGVNADITPLAIDRAAQLLLQICPGATVAAGVVDVYPEPKEVRRITFTPKEINAYLGTDIEAEKMMDILLALGFTTVQDAETIIGTIGHFVLGVESEPTHIVVEVPSWRDDVSHMADIAEEIARIYGYDNIAVTTPVANLQGGTISPKKQLIKDIKRYLSEAGLCEIITFSFMHQDSLVKLQIPDTDTRYQAVPILNPISEEFPLMRTTLLPSVIDTALRNVAQKNLDLQLFEVGAVYEPQVLPVTELPKEHMMACGILMGRAGDVQWNVAERLVDFYDAKGVVGGLLRSLGIEDVLVERSDAPYLHPGVSARISKEGICLAELGELHPAAAKAYGISGKAYVFEVDLDAILDVTRLPISYEPISKFPGITRDLAIVAPYEVDAQDIMAIIEELGGPLLEKAYVFDVYEGAHIEAGHRSLAYSLWFRSHEGTLTDADVEGNIQDILKALEEKNCKLR